MEVDEGAEGDAMANAANVGSEPFGDAAGEPARGLEDP